MKIETLHQHFLQSSGICTDTRKITQNCIYVALKGDNFDGNNFTQEALDKGAFKVIIDDIRQHKNTGETILHKDALALLQKLATFHRRYLNIPILSITGSNGKTTTKELIREVLAQKYKVVATVGNLNNHIGVPLTLLSMDSSTEMGIVEMGANHQKEIEALCKIAEPNFGYITNFGKAHLEGFGGIDGVIKGKSEMYKHLANLDELVFVNGNDPKQLLLTKNIKRHVFGNEEQDTHIILKNASQNLIVEFEGNEIESQMIGTYNFHNIAAAIAIGSYFEAPFSDIKKAIEGYIPTNNRSQIIEKSGHKIVLDAYNANPTSMMAALENFHQMPASAKILFLGDMFEVGETASTEHQNTVDFIERYSIGHAYLIGENFYETRVNSEKIKKFRNFEDLKFDLENQNLIKSNILIKASRGMALERILDLL